MSEPAPRQAGSGWGYWVSGGVAALLIAAAVAAFAVHDSTNSSPAPSGIVAPPVATTTTTAPPAGSDGSIGPEQGAILYTDDFRSSSSGWTTGSLPSGTSFSYGSDGYVITARGALQHFTLSPYNTPVSSVGVEMTAAQDAAAAPTAGFGVTCVQDYQQADQVVYNLAVVAGGTWYIDRVDPSNPNPVEVAHGRTADVPGSSELTVEGVCDTLGDGTTTRLVLFVAGRQVADVKDADAALPDTGWLTGIDVESSASSASTVTVGRFVERNPLSPGS